MVAVEASPVDAARLVFEAADEVVLVEVVVVEGGLELDLRVTNVEIFSDGSVSPVKDDSSMDNSIASNIRIWAGIRSPQKI